MLCSFVGLVLFGWLSAVYVVFPASTIPSFVRFFLDKCILKMFFTSVLIKSILKIYYDPVILRQTSCFVIDPSTISDVFTFRLHFLPARDHIIKS